MFKSLNLLYFHLTGPQQSLTHCIDFATTRFHQRHIDILIILMESVCFYVRNLINFISNHYLKTFYVQLTFLKQCTKNP